MAWRDGPARTDIIEPILAKLLGESEYFLTRTKLERMRLPKSDNKSAILHPQEDVRLPAVE